MNKAPRYISLIITILLSLGSGFLLFIVITAHGENLFARGLNDPFIIFKSYSILLFIISLLAVVFNFIMLNTATKYPSESIDHHLIDNPVLKPSKSKLLVFLWGSYAVFSTLTILLPLFMYSPYFIDEKIVVNISIKAISVIVIVILLAIYLQRDALITRKYITERI